MVRSVLLFVLAVLSIPTASAQAQPADRLAAPAPLVVAVAERPPFAQKDADGSWQGIAVNLWRTSAEELGLSYRLVDAEEADLVSGVGSGRFDVALPVYANAEAAAETDLAFPFYTSTLGLAERRSNKILETARNLITWQFLRIILYLSVLLLVVGAIVWIIERGKNGDQFSPSPVKGLGDGFWWAGVTLTTIGYGDKAPATPLGRGVAMVWMLIGLGVSAVLTASVVSAMDISAKGTPLADITDEKVGVVEASGAYDYLRAKGVQPETFGDAEAGMKAAREGRIDIFVHPAPHLKVLAKEGNGTLMVTTSKADPVAVTFALTPGSGLAAPLEEVIVARVTSEDWWNHVERWVPQDQGS